MSFRSLQIIERRYESIEIPWLDCETVQVIRRDPSYVFLRNGSSGHKEHTQKQSQNDLRKWHFKAFICCLLYLYLVQKKWAFHAWHIVQYLHTYRRAERQSFFLSSSNFIFFFLALLDRLGQAIEILFFLMFLSCRCLNIKKWLFTSVSNLIRK